MSPRNAFKFDHGQRRGKQRTAGTLFEAFAKRRRAKCKPGATIKSMPALLRYLRTSPSVWFFTAGKPMPSTVLLNWQMRQVVWYLDSGRFGKVIRP